MVFSFFVFEIYFIAISIIITKSRHLSSSLTGSAYCSVLDVETNYSDYYSKQTNNILNKNLYRFSTGILIGIKNKGYSFMHCCIRVPFISAIFSLNTVFTVVCFF